MAKKDKFTVHITPRPASDQCLIDPLLETLQKIREEKSYGIIIGVIMEDGVLSYAQFTDDCESRDVRLLTKQMRLATADALDILLENQGE
jgi:hypothetical protein